MCGVAALGLRKVNGRQPQANDLFLPTSNKYFQQFVQVKQGSLVVTDIRQMMMQKWRPQGYPQYTVSAEDSLFGIALQESTQQ